VDPPRIAEGAVALTVDLEEWFHAPEHPLGGDFDAWDTLPLTIPEALGRCLDLLGSWGVRATFFTLGWAAERHPDEVRRIAREGHEVACHGWAHQPVDKMPPEVFREDVRKARDLLGGILGHPVRGYRAPRWSIGRAIWPYEILGELGFEYSSSRLPLPGLGCGPGPMRVAGVLELPALTSSVLGVRLPAGGTVALRTRPMKWLEEARTESLLRGWPAVYWFHPWELLTAAPRLGGGRLFRWVRYSGLEALPGRIGQLVPPGDRRMGPIAKSL
jgi:polysaccharide deacetylase family protein (PEP-CTERM system associated)